MKSVLTFFSTVEDDIIVDQAESPEIVDDFELGKEEAVDVKDKEVNKQKLRRRIDQYKVSFFFLCVYLCVNDSSSLYNNVQINLRTPCRQGKKLLVLDIDYTLFDHRSTAENPLQLMRPCKPYTVNCLVLAS